MTLNEKNNHHTSQGHGIISKLFNRIYLYVANLPAAGARMVALVMREFILCLQFTPAAPLFGYGSSPYLSEQTDKPSLRSPVHGEFLHTAVVDLGATRSGNNERIVHPTAMPVGLQQHGTRAFDKDENHD